MSRRLFWKSILGFICAGAVAATDQSPSGPFAVGTLEIDWHDAKRDREVPAKIYFPQSGAGPFPVILFSHGLGGTRDGYSYLGRFWATNGYVVVHLQHLGSDDAVWRGGGRPMEKMKAATLNPKNSMDRPLDVSFALDQLAVMNQQAGPLRGHLDLQRVGLAGHSYGAFTTLACAGQRWGAAGKTLAEARIKAAIAMSAPVPRAVNESSYAAIQIPILHLTGTKDVSPISDTTAQDRRVPFDVISGAPQWLLTFKDGDHMVFSGATSPRRDPVQDALFHDLICQSTTAFWDAWLRQETKAKDWLTTGAFAKAVGGAGVVEMKNIK
jgi:predicted dienelactone hydrolase